MTEWTFVSLVFEYYSVVCFQANPVNVRHAYVIYEYALYNVHSCTGCIRVRCNRDRSVPVQKHRSNRDKTMTQSMVKNCICCFCAFELRSDKLLPSQPIFFVFNFSTYQRSIWYSARNVCWCTGSASWTAEVAWRRRNSIRRFDVHPVIRTEHYHMGLCEQYQNGSSIHTHVMKCGACAVVWPVALCRLSIGTACFGRSSHGNSFPSHIQSMIDFACIGMEIGAVFFSISLFVALVFCFCRCFLSSHAVGFDNDGLLSLPADIDVEMPGVDKLFGRRSLNTFSSAAGGIIIICMHWA